MCRFSIVTLDFLFLKYALRPINFSLDVDGVFGVVTLSYGNDF